MQRPASYLAEQVARCQDSHTPKLDSGEPDKTKWLKGGKLTIAAVGTIPGWHPTSPDITSTSALWQRWGDDAADEVSRDEQQPSRRQGRLADAGVPLRP